MGGIQILLSKEDNEFLNEQMKRKTAQVAEEKAAAA